MINEYTFIITVTREAKTEEEAWEEAKELLLDSPEHYIDNVYVEEDLTEDHSIDEED